MDISVKQVQQALRDLAQAQRNPHKARAFQKAAQALEGKTSFFLRGLSFSDLVSIPGIGRSSAEVIFDLLHTGKSERYEREVGLPFGCDLTKLRGVGVKTAQQIVAKYGVKTIAELKQLADEGNLKDEKLLAALTQYARYKQRMPWFTAFEAISYLKTKLEKECSLFVPCGSYRRLRSTVGDLDILLVDAGKDIASRLKKLKGWVTESEGKEKISGTLKLDDYEVHVDFLLVPAKYFGAAVNYFTGSKEFNIALRRRAKAKGFKVNEKWVEDASGRKIFLKREEDLFELLDLNYVPPECREEGSLEEFAFKPWKAPIIDYHLHTTFSDGTCSLEEWQRFYRSRHWISVLGISDHSKPNPAAIKSLAAYAKKVRSKGFLVGLELEVLKDGVLPSDYTLEQLKQHLDYVILSAHYKQDAILQTANLIKRLAPLPVILAHLSGRLLGKREGVAEEELISFLNRLKPLKRRVAVEINAQPNRLDPPYRVLRFARKLGFKIALSSDNHKGPKTLPYLQLLARRRAYKGLVRKSDLLVLKRR